MSGFPPAVRRLIHERAGGCCEVCGMTITEWTPRSIHHRRPRGMGGSKNLITNSAANGLLLDGSGTTGCHGRIESNRAEALELGLLVPQYADPTTTPVQLHVGRVLLGDDGTYIRIEETP